MRKLDINHLTEAATAEAEMDVSNEPSVTPENLRELVAKETKLATAALLKQVTKLQSIVNATKNLKGSGARNTPRGALPKKTKKTKKTNGKTVSFAASAAQPADDADSDTSKKKGRRSSKQSKKQNGKSTKNSRTGNRK